MSVFRQTRSPSGARERCPTQERTPMADPADKRAAFRRLHEAGCFVMPNPWDAGTAAALENVGFKALASTSAGMAWSLGRPDGGVTLDEVLAHLRMLDAATSLPLNADFENGFADDPS